MMPEPSPHRRCYFVTLRGDDVAGRLADEAKPGPAIFDHRENAERYAERSTPEGESWRDHFELYEVHPVS